MTKHVIVIRNGRVTRDGGPGSGQQMSEQYGEILPASGKKFVIEERDPVSGPSSSQKISSAAKMYGTGSKQHREAIKRFGGRDAQFSDVDAWHDALFAKYEDSRLKIIKERVRGTSAGYKNLAFVDGRLVGEFVVGETGWTKDAVRRFGGGRDAATTIIMVGASSQAAAWTKAVELGYQPIKTAIETSPGTYQLEVEGKTRDAWTPEQKAKRDQEALERYHAKSDKEKKLLALEVNLRDAKRRAKEGRGPQAVQGANASVERIEAEIASLKSQSDSAADASYHAVAGQEAKAAGRPETDNPYPKGSDPHRLWLEGWRGSHNATRKSVYDAGGSHVTIKAGFGVKVGQDFWRAQEDTPAEFVSIVGGGSVKVRLLGGKFGGYTGIVPRAGVEGDVLVKRGDVSHDAELSDNDLIDLAERVGTALNKNRSREDQLRRDDKNEEANKIYYENKEEARRIFRSGGISAGEFDKRMQKLAGRTRLNVKASRLFGDSAHDADETIAGLSYDTFVKLENRVAKMLDADSGWDEVISVATDLGATRQQAEAIADDLGRRRGDTAHDFATDVEKRKYEVLLEKVGQYDKGEKFWWWTYASSPQEAKNIAKNQAPSNVRVVGEVRQIDIAHDFATERGYVVTVQSPTSSYQSPMFITRSRAEEWLRSEIQKAKQTVAGIISFRQVDPALMADARSDDPPVIRRGTPERGVKISPPDDPKERADWEVAVRRRQAEGGGKYVGDGIFTGLENTGRVKVAWAAGSAFAKMGRTVEQLRTSLLNEGANEHELSEAMRMFDGTKRYPSIHSRDTEKEPGSGHLLTEAEVRQAARDLPLNQEEEERKFLEKYKDLPPSSKKDKPAGDAISDNLIKLPLSDLLRADTDDRNGEVWVMVGRAVVDGPYASHRQASAVIQDAIDRKKRTGDAASESDVAEAAAKYEGDEAAASKALKEQGWPLADVLRVVGRIRKNLKAKTGDEDWMEVGRRLAQKGWTSSEVAAIVRQRKLSSTEAMLLGMGYDEAKKKVSGDHDSCHAGCDCDDCLDKARDATPEEKEEERVARMVRKELTSIQEKEDAEQKRLDSQHYENRRLNRYT